MDYDWTLEESKKLAAAELPLAMQAASGTIDLSLRLIASASMPEQKEVKQRKRQAQAAELIGAKMAKREYQALRAQVKLHEMPRRVWELLLQPHY